MGEYAASQGLSYGPTNNLNLNFNRPLDRRARPVWTCEELAIHRTTTAFRIALGECPPRTTLVPVPPSKAHSDPLHDDRVTRMLETIWPGEMADVREKIAHSASTDAMHETCARPDPSRFKAGHRIDEALTAPESKFNSIVGDVPTPRAHYGMVASALATRLPSLQIVGPFIARRVPDADPAS